MNDYNELIAIVGHGGQPIPLVSSHSPNPSDLILDVCFSGLSIMEVIMFSPHANCVRWQNIITVKIPFGPYIVDYTPGVL
jgi:hypothetical protein